MNSFSVFSRNAVVGTEVAEDGATPFIVHCCSSYQVAIEMHLDNISCTLLLRLLDFLKAGQCSIV